MCALYSLAELDAEILLIKDAIRDAALGKVVTVGGQTYQPQDLQQLREHLAWLQAQRSQALLEAGQGGAGCSRLLQFRPARGGRA